MDFGMPMALLACCVCPNIRVNILPRADLLTVSPCALSADPRVEKAFDILQRYIERLAVCCGLLHGV